MELSILKRIGMTEGEIRVYEALLGLSKSSTGLIMQKSGISSSKVYLILDKLAHKGLATFVVENGVKYYQITHPKSLLKYIDIKEEELESTRKEFEKIMPFISSKLKVEQESTQVYKGIKGIQVAYDSLLSSLKKGEEYCLFAIRADEAEDELVFDLLAKFHKKRVKKGVKVRVIADSVIEKLYKKKHLLSSLYALRHYDLTLPTGIVIGKDRVLSFVFGKDSTLYEIISIEMTRRYQDFFDKIWKLSLH